MKTIFITVLTAICLTLTGCGVSQEDYDKLKQDNAALSQQNVTLREQVSKITAERDAYKSKYEQIAPKPIATGSVITDFSDLTRRIKSYKGQTVTVEGLIISVGSPDLGVFKLKDKNWRDMYIFANPDDWGVIKDDRVRVTGIVKGKYDIDPAIFHVTSVQRI